MYISNQGQAKVPMNIYICEHVYSIPFRDLLKVMTALEIRSIPTHIHVLGRAIQY